MRTDVSMRKVTVLLASLLPAVWGASVAAADDGYVGQDVCLGCHEDVLENYEHTIHYRVFREGNARNARMTRGCEACHGPGQAHVEAGGGKGAGGDDWVAFTGKYADAARQNEACLGCHEGAKLLYWQGSPHEMRGNTCTDCHYTHDRVSSEHYLTKPTQQEVCAECHMLPRSQTWRNAHHPQREGPATGITDPGREGFMDCASCHNPHGTVTEHLVTAATSNDLCYTCHADKRGPWLWEHAPVQEDCGFCHVPHGSIHPAMLRVSSPRLCQSCHNPTLHPTEARRPESRFVIQQSCQNCHFKVHGSNHPSGMFLTR